MREIIKGIDKEEKFIIKDYGLEEEKVVRFFNSMNFEELLDSKNLAECLFTEQPEIRIIPKGFRILSKSKLKDERIHQLVDKFVNLENIFNADVDRLRDVVASVGDFRQEINSLREQIMVGKKI
jgi:DNA integrity scanning protein DisA with diadenylate cyclase activity